jgi:hypothetical protein
VEVNSNKDTTVRVEFSSSQYTTEEWALCATVSEMVSERASEWVASQFSVQFSAVQEVERIVRALP